jgi:hypothetical protein
MRVRVRVGEGEGEGKRRVRRIGGKRSSLLTYTC